MDITRLSKQFYALVAPSLPNEWDVEDSLQPLAGEPEDITTAALNQVPVIWPVSHSLCFAYLSNVKEAIPHITTDNLDIWVKELLAHYESGGLRSVRALMEDVGSFLPRLQGKKGLRLEDVQGRLQPYVNGLAGREVPLVPSGTTYTDTHSIFLPQELELPEAGDEAFFLYKFIITFQWASLELGTVGTRGYGTPATGSRHPLQDFFTSGNDPPALMQLYHYFEMVRTLAFLKRELPGLMKAFAGIAPLLRSRLPAADNSRDLVLHLQHRLLAGTGFKNKKSPLLKRIDHWARQCDRPGAKRKTSRDAARDTAALLAEDQWYTCEGKPLVFQGEIRLQEVMAAVQRQRAQKQQLFIETFASYLAQSPDFTPDEESADGEDPAGNAPDREPAAAVVKRNGEREQPAPDAPLLILLDNREIELNEELSEMVEEIIDDLGRLPAHYVSSAVGKAGQSVGMPNLGEGDEAGELSARFVYDEWDYRRKGYRKDWCVVTEKAIEAVRSSFVEDTLTRYRHRISMLKHQFELLQTTDRFIHRQREGDDIDFDAVVESLADTRAGYPPSDKLFIRLMRDERDIAVMFLVDMSNSTEGWVGRTIKEALILISEAMEMLSDRYAIYGFSGMRRLRCEIFPIKTLDERYNSEVRDRIAAISPREYTRMAPAVRHMTSLFKQVEAKLRLLVILSDGKPEDYDDYKGEYAVEDTRHALFEAKAGGVHPFCITIDKHAQSYMARMYGPANYIFVDSLKRLPMLMPEIYRTLTT